MPRTAHMISKEVCYSCPAGRLVQSIKDHQVTKNTITFPWVVEDPKKPVHLLKIFPDEPGHRIVNSVPSKL